MKIQQEKSKSIQPQDLNQSTRITKNSFSLLLANATDLTFGLVSIAIFARYLGVEVYGQYAFIMSIVLVFLTLPHFGMRRVIMREVTKDKEKADQYLGSVIIIRCILSAMAFGAVAITIKLLGFSGIYIMATYIIMASEIVSSFSMAFITIFFAFERMVYNTFLTTVNRTLGIVLILIVVSLDLGFIPLMLSLFIPNILTLCLSYTLVIKKITKPRFCYHPAQWKYLLKESYPLFIELVFRQNFLRVDIFVLKAIRSVAEISVFYAPYSLILRLQMIPAAFTTALLPPLSRLADGSKMSFAITYVKAFKILLTISLPIAIAVSILADNIIVIIFGRTFLKAAIALKILIWMVNLMFFESLFNAVFVSIKKQWLSAISHAVMFSANLVLDIILVPFYGFVGACIGTLFAYISRFFLSYYFLLRNNISLPIVSILPKPLLSGAIMGMMMYLFIDWNIIATLSIGLAAYIGAIILTGTFSREEIGMFTRARNLRSQNL